MEIEYMSRTTHYALRTIFHLTRSFNCPFAELLLHILHGFVESFLAWIGRIPQPKLAHIFAQAAHA